MRNAKRPGARAVPGTVSPVGKPFGSRSSRRLGPGPGPSRVCRIVAASIRLHTSAAASADAADGADALQQRALSLAGTGLKKQPHELIEKLRVTKRPGDPRDPPRRIRGVGPGEERREKTEVRRETLHVRLGHLAIAIAGTLGAEPPIAPGPWASPP